MFEVGGLFDEHGATLTAYDVLLTGLGPVRTSSGGLSAAPESMPATIEISRSAYPDTSVLPIEQPAGEEFELEEDEPPAFPRSRWPQRLS